MTSRAEPHIPTLALALGGGGARGLAHIVVLEALDDLGVRPVAIAGTSIGAIIGACYAAGVSGRAIRAHMLEMLRDRPQVMARLLQARVGRVSDLFARGMGNPVLVDGEKLLDLFWPESVPDRFEDLQIPFLAIATDYYGRGEVLLDRGPLVSAVAASMAIPGLVRPVVIEGRVMLDGGAVNPLPFDRLADRASVTLAVDVTGGPVAETAARPEPFAAMLGASQIMQGAIVAEKLRARRPDLLIRPEVDAFRALDFFKAKTILAAAEPVRDEVKRGLERLLDQPDLTPAGRRKTT
jgi:NTE family protein